MLRASLLVVVLLPLAVPAAQAQGVLENCDQYPIGVEEACETAGPAVNENLAEIGRRLACLIEEKPPVEWPACLPGVPTIPGLLPWLQYCRNPTWDKCVDGLLGPLPL